MWLWATNLYASEQLSLFVLDYLNVCIGYKQSRVGKILKASSLPFIQLAKMSIDKTLDENIGFWSHLDLY